MLRVLRMAISRRDRRRAEKTEERKSRNDDVYMQLKSVLRFPRSRRC